MIINTENSPLQTEYANHQRNIYRFISSQKKIQRTQLKMFAMLCAKCAVVYQRKQHTHIPDTT